MKHLPAFLACLFLSAVSLLAFGEDPFGVDLKIETGAAGKPSLVVAVTVPPDHHLYADTFKVEAAAGIALIPVSHTPPKKEKDPAGDEMREVYDGDFVHRFMLEGSVSNTLPINVRYQGCKATSCYFPQERHLVVTVPEQFVNAAQATPVSTASTNPPPPSTISDDESLPADLVKRFVVTGKTTGYQSVSEFTAFLENARNADHPANDNIFAAKGLVVAMLLIILSGMALNLTPCILPMIPVNLAIIGAGTQNASKMRGFALGGVYGAGIALAYGSLGLLVLFTGVKFGALNSSPWFNLGIAVVFLVLALGMFEVFLIDLSRFQRGTKTGEKRGGYGVALVMGVVSALLAGACVAPAVIAVLVFAASLHAQGSPVAYLLPFLLGIGMALPWPFAGAGLAFLPRPGMWMKRVNIVFGIIILIAAAYYGYEGVSLLRARSVSSRAAVSDAARSATSQHGWQTSLARGLSQSLTEGKPVIVDFWATWCKNCLAMEKSTLSDPETIQALDGFIKVKYNAERPGDLPNRQVLDYFQVVGMPTYIVLKPGAAR